MGHGSSRPGVTEPVDDSSGGSKGSSSRFSRLKQRLHIRRHHSLHHHRRRDSDSTSGSLKLHSAEDFAGIALVKLISAEMKFKDKWMACISFGEQTFRTEVSDQLSNPWLIDLSLLSRCFAWSTVRELDSITNLLHTERVLLSKS